MDTQELLERTYNLSKKLADRSAVERINKVQNAGKRIQMCVSTNLLLDTFEAFEEYRSLLNEQNAFKNSKVSLSLLTRYIFESYVNFLYIFKAKKTDVQKRTKAFYNYGDYKKGIMQGKEELENEKREWSKYLPPKGKSTQWHGQSFQQLCKEANYKPIVYQALSQFSHPGIFTFERVLNTEIFEGIVEDSVLFTSAAVFDMMAYANKYKLYGLKLGANNEREIRALIKSHDDCLNELRKAKLKGA